MPLLLCPNDNTAMQEIDRNGVRIDVCPACRGVWLDRGELEKLLDLVGRDRAEAGPADPRSYDDRSRRSADDDRRHDASGRDPWAHEPRGHDPSGFDSRRSDARGYDARKRKKRFDLFDFFD